jgi:hypothetical protein
MAHMTLPSEHSEADALLAEHIGQTLGLEEVHVFWTLPRSEPVVPEGPRPAYGPLAVVGALAALLGRIVAPRRSPDRT